MQPVWKPIKISNVFYEVAKADLLPESMASLDNLVEIMNDNPRITIRWIVSNKDVVNILVNNYSLKSYNGSTWRYHAFINQNTLKEWANSYTIQYLDKNSRVIYKEYYSIYKEKTKKIIVKKKIEKKKEKEEIKEVKIISSEAQIN